jgi:hypothetical protein
MARSSPSSPRALEDRQQQGVDDAEDGNEDRQS